MVLFFLSPPLSFLLAIPAALDMRNYKEPDPNMPKFDAKIFPHAIFPHVYNGPIPSVRFVVVFFSFAFLRSAPQQHSRTAWDCRPMKRDGDPDPHQRA